MSELEEARKDRSGAVDDAHIELVSQMAGGCHSNAMQRRFNTI